MFQVNKQGLIVNFVNGKNEIKRKVRDFDED
jgi:hypothetical protein